MEDRDKRERIVATIHDQSHVGVNRTLVLFIAHICVMWYNYVAMCLTDVSILLSDPCLKIVFLGDNSMVAAFLSAKGVGYKTI